MKKILFILPLAISLLCSCNSWIEVRPYDRMSNDMLFETREGFQKALNGVYVGMVDRKLYGRQMTVDMIDIMAQYYTTHDTYNRLSAMIVYNYEDDEFKKNISEAWERYYSLIGNCNSLIEACGVSNDVLPGYWHPLFKGEALALRGFLHLDVLRFWGPVYSHDPKGKYLPYRKTADPQVDPLISSEEFIGYVIDDLEEALSLLKESDPVFTNGLALLDDNENNSTTQRQLRMNYFAVKLVLARAYLWKGDREKAYELSKGLIEESRTYFSFTPVTSANASARYPQRNFTSEIMFALLDDYRLTQVYDRVFNPDMSSALNYCLIFAAPGNSVWDGKIKVVYPDPQDVRLGFFATNVSDNKIFHYSKKYTNSTPSLMETDHTKFLINIFNTVMPLVRMSEAYYIAAETAPTVSEGCGYLNTVLQARDAKELMINTSDMDELMASLEAEYKREFMAEGQLFYLYKRLGKTSLPSAPTVSGTITMSLDTYRVPLPESERSLRDDYIEDKKEE